MLVHLDHTLRYRFIILCLHHTDNNCLVYILVYFCNENYEVVPSIQVNYQVNCAHRAYQHHTVVIIVIHTIR